LKISISSHPQTNGQNKVENIALTTMPSDGRGPSTTFHEKQEPSQERPRSS